MAKINAGKVSDMPPNSITKLENAETSQLQMSTENFMQLLIHVHMLELAWQTAKLTERTSSVDGTQHPLNVRVANLQNFQQK